MKSFLALIILIFLTACTNTRYYYYPENYKNSDISISASLVEFGKEDSALDYIWVLDLRDHYDERHDVKILSSTIKINSNGKEYTINAKPDSEHIYIYKQGIIITNAVSDALNKGAQTKEIFSGTVEDYKKQKK